MLITIAKNNFSDIFIYFRYNDVADAKHSDGTGDTIVFRLGLHTVNMIHDLAHRLLPDQSITIQGTT